MIKTLAPCLVLSLSLAIAAAYSADTPKAEPSKTIEVMGPLETGVVAIGGETTGVVVRTKDGVFELDLGDDTALKQACKELNKKKVSVTGVLRIIPGVETKERRLIRVAKISAAD